MIEGVNMDNIDVIEETFSKLDERFKALEERKESSIVVTTDVEHDVKSSKDLVCNILKQRKIDLVLDQIIDQVQQYVYENFSETAPNLEEEVCKRTKEAFVKWISVIDVNADTNYVDIDGVLVKKSLIDMATNKTARVGEVRTDSQSQVLRDAANEIERIANEAKPVQFDLVRREGRGHLGVVRR
jgi:hypothetical protein